MSMCSASLDIFTMMEARQGAEISQPMRFVYIFILMQLFVYNFKFFFSSNCRTLNSKKTSGTMGRHASTTSMKQKNKDLNPKRMHEEVPIKDINIFLNLFHFLSTSIFILHFLLFFVSLTGSNGQKSQSIPKPKTCNCQRRRTDATFSKNR